MKKHKHKGGHTGKISMSGMGSHITGLGGKDPHADPMHQKANVAAGMPQGMSPVGGYDGEAAGCSQCQGGEGMTDNGGSY